MASTRSSFGSSVLALWLLLLSCGVSAAAEDTDAMRSRKFRELYAQATRIYNEKQYAAAIPYLQAAFAIEPVPELLFNIAQAYRKLDQYNSARVYFELYRSTDTQMAPEKAELIDRLVLELREREQEAQAPKVQVVEKTKLVYVQSEKPLPRWLRPLGIAEGVVGLGALAVGATFLGLNGRCASDPLPQALECEQLYATLTPGVAFTVAGAGLVLLGVVTFGVSFKRPARAVVSEKPLDKEPLPALQEVMPASPPLDEEPAPAGERPVRR